MSYETFSLSTSGLLAPSQRTCSPVPRVGLRQTIAVGKACDTMRTVAADVAAYCGSRRRGASIEKASTRCGYVTASPAVYRAWLVDGTGRDE
jgi:hypothetical protein